MTQSSENTVLRRDLPLLIDDECCNCGKLVARSNIKHNGHHKLCGRCYEIYGGTNVNDTN